MGLPFAEHLHHLAQSPPPDSCPKITKKSPSLSTKLSALLHCAAGTATPQPSLRVSASRVAAAPRVAQRVADALGLQARRHSSGCPKCRTTRNSRCNWNSQSCRPGTKLKEYEDRLIRVPSESGCEPSTSQRVRSSTLIQFGGVRQVLPASRTWNCPTSSI